MDIHDDGRPRTYYRFDRLGDAAPERADFGTDRTCETCGRTAMPYDAADCPRCGAELPAAEAFGIDLTKTDGVLVVRTRMDTETNLYIAQAQCPKCGELAEDLAGLGVLAHIPGCGYCSHPHRDGGVCRICGGRETAA